MLPCTHSRYVPGDSLCYRLLQTYVCLTLDTMTEYDYVPFKAFLSFVDPALFSILDPPLEL